MSSPTQLAIEVLQHSKRILYVTDRTGPYDAATNPQGWGADDTDPNPDVADVADVGSTPGIIFLLTVLGIEYSYSDTAAVKALGWPNTSNSRIALTAANFGLETFPDGEFSLTAQCAGTFTWDDSGTPTTEGFHTQDTKTGFFYKQAQCCVEKLAVAVDPHCKDICKDEDWAAWNRADTHYRNLTNLIDGEMYEAAACELEVLQTICSQENAACDEC